MNEKQKKDEDRLKRLIANITIDNESKVSENNLAANVALCHGPMPEIALKKNIFQVAPDTSRDVKTGDAEPVPERVIPVQDFFSNTIVPSDNSSTSGTAPIQESHQATPETAEHRAAVEQQQARMDEEALKSKPA